MPTRNPEIVYVDADFKRRTVQLIRSDHKETNLALPSAPNSSLVEGVRFVVGVPIHFVRTSSGKEFALELPEKGDAAPLRGRSVVYLDQNMWSKLATVRQGGTCGNSEEDRHARMVIDLVHENQIILPCSGGTLNETLHWTNQIARRNLGETVLELSRGWQMTSPLELRKEELRGALREKFKPEDGSVAAPSPWTLGMKAILTDRKEILDGDLLVALPEHTQLADAMTGAVILTEMLLSPDPLSRLDPAGWCAHWQQLSDALKVHPGPKDVRAKGALAGALLDARLEIYRVATEDGIDPGAAAEWLSTDLLVNYKMLPAFGLACDVICLKLLGGGKWQPNDLSDIFYLVHAAGYADAVVGERSFTSFTRNAQKRLGRQETAFKSFTELLKSQTIA